ncbi:endonuclease/exonuclease/phosphatase (EEP) superfamily protein YafD [Agrobacterium larrymoorei]|uniref:Endonuclease/exonuclease/phosphatase (EEP) superfamily protein YafD n=2 Tax=Agrobacterium larrymoorei TaxID=160699 RepID=A0ABU0UNT4_9HYPH|nr:endonuclease/exonuclease/phosphatase (EEP) superfamily protein YafD [Agrobacterium larrymoorei]
MKARLSCIASMAIVAALFSISFRYIKDFWLLAFVNSFQLHIAVVAAIACIICFCLLRSRLFIALLAWSLVLCAHAVSMQYDFATDGQYPAGAKPFRLMSFNVLRENRKSAESIADAVLASEADAVYIMEAGAVRSVLARLQQTYPYRLGCGVGTPSCDLLMLSKRPLRDARIGTLSFVSQERAGFAQIDLDGVTLNLAQVHLTKPYFDEYHAEELSGLSRELINLKGPVILAGDFNSASVVPDMRRFMENARLKKGSWEPATWPIKAGRFGIAIDHVFARKPATLISVQRLPNNLGSNHYGLIADFMIAAE